MPKDSPPVATAVQILHFGPPEDLHLSVNIYVKDVVQASSALLFSGKERAGDAKVSDLPSHHGSGTKPQDKEQSYH